MSGEGYSKEKDRLRRQVRERRLGLATAWVAETSRSVQTRALALPAWTDASVVGCYLAMPGEVTTELILERGRSDGKTVCVPAYDRTSGEYALVCLKADSGIVAGPMGVPEPASGERIGSGAVDCIFVPALAFDADGSRLGHGGGHYDRILAGVRRNTVKVGLAFGFQIYESIPVLGHDVPMDVVVCEDKTITCSARSG